MEFMNTLTCSTTRLVVVWTVATSLSCGPVEVPTKAPTDTLGTVESATPTREQSTSAPTEAVEVPEPTEKLGETGVPEECPASGECLPPQSWVKKLCAGVFQDVALYMFRPGTPWQRRYLTREVEAVNASGGASVAGKVAFDEEVIILGHRGAGSGGIQIDGSEGSYDAIRWNGSCVTLEGGELTTQVPPKAKASRVEWKWLSDSMQAALREDATLNATYLARRKECKGATMGEVSRRCERLDREFVEVVVNYVRRTPGLPGPGDKP
ncbi:MAG: hypothetical protein RJA70_681 [Pseudomonadota bacterium]|jgi:hypothetical protein